MFALLHMYKMKRNIWRPAFHIKQNIYEQNVNKIFSPLKSASFDTFCVPTGHIFEPHWAFEDSVKSAILTFLKEYLCQKRTFSDLNMLIVARIIDRFEHKRHQKKRMWINWVRMLFRFCSKIFCLKWTACHQIFVHYILLE